MKIILVSGFLGSGKTRFIKFLVENTKKSVVILENEFGDLNLDGEYLKNDLDSKVDDLKVWELTNGCICCSTNLDFTHSILTIANTLNPDYLIVDAKNYENIIKNYSDYLKDDLLYNGLIVVSKSENLEEEQFIEIKNILSINNDVKFPLKHYSKWDKDIWDYIFSTTGVFSDSGNKLSLKFKVEKEKPERKLDQYTIKNIGITSVDKLSYILLYLMSKKVGNIERVKGNLTIQDNSYKFDLVGENYEITGSNVSLGNNAVVIGSNLQKDILEKLFEN